MGQIPYSFKVNFKDLSFSTGKVSGESNKPQWLSPILLSVQSDAKKFRHQF